MAIVPTLKVLSDFYEIEDILAYLKTMGKEDMLPEPLKQSISGVTELLKTPYPPPDYGKKFYPDSEFFKRSYPITLKNVEKIKKVGGNVGCGNRLLRNGA